MTKQKKKRKICIVERLMLFERERCEPCDSCDDVECCGNKNWESDDRAEQEKKEVHIRH